MTEDIWDEKPLRVRVLEDSLVYPVLEMDAWLEKLKAEGDRLKELVVIYEKQYGNVTEYAIELEHKLEAVKKYAEKLSINLYVPIKRGGIELLKILEGET